MSKLRRVLMIEEETWREARVRALRAGKTMGDWVAELIEQDLKKAVVGPRGAEKVTPVVEQAEDEWLDLSTDPSTTQPYVVTPRKLSSQALTSKAE